METKMIAQNIADGSVHYSDCSENITDIKWIEHPQFQGVYLKHMITGDKTEGLFSSHMRSLGFEIREQK